MLRDIESIDSKMLFLMELRNLVGKTYNTHKSKEMCKVCEDHDNSYARNKSGYFIREHLKGCRINWIVSAEGTLEQRQDIKASVM